MIPAHRPAYLLLLTHPTGPGQNQLTSRVPRATASGKCGGRDNSLDSANGEEGKPFGANSFPESVLIMQEALHQMILISALTRAKLYQCNCL